MSGGGDTSRRRELLADFVHLLYEEKDVEGAFGGYVTEDYLQHSPGLPDGRAAAVAVLTDKFADPELQLTVRRILLDADMAVILVHGRAGGDIRFAVVDIYRLVGDKIVEHWDVNQRFPDDIRNGHPFFSADGGWSGG